LKRHNLYIALLFIAFLLQAWHPNVPAQAPLSGKSIENSFTGEINTIDQGMHPVSVFHRGSTAKQLLSTPDLVRLLPESQSGSGFGSEPSSRLQRPYALIINGHFLPWAGTYIRKLIFPTHSFL
jgi:hypothetical protein